MPTLSYRHPERLILAALLMAMIAGCGFQLKGTSQEGEAQWAGVTMRLISVDPRSELTRELSLIHI